MTFPLTPNEAARVDLERAEKVDALHRMISAPAPDIDPLIGHRRTCDGDAGRVVELIRGVGSVEHAARKTAIDAAGPVTRIYEFRDLGDENDARESSC